MFNAKSVEALEQQQKVQSLTVSLSEPHLQVASGADLIVLVREPIARIIDCLVIDDSVPGVVVKPASTLSIVDSTAYTAGGDLGGIKITTLALAANDTVTVRYIAQN